VALILPEYKSLVFYLVISNTLRAPPLLNLTSRRTYAKGTQLQIKDLVLLLIELLIQDLFHQLSTYFSSSGIFSVPLDYIIFLLGSSHVVSEVLYKLPADGPIQPLLLESRLKIRVFQHTA
jgi:hypothetical protein